MDTKDWLKELVLMSKTNNNNNHNNYSREQQSSTGPDSKQMFLDCEFANASNINSNTNCSDLDGEEGETLGYEVRSDDGSDDGADLEGFVVNKSTAKIEEEELKSEVSEESEDESSSEESSSTDAQASSEDRPSSAAEESDIDSENEYLNKQPGAKRKRLD
jgi:hypothetical protein